MAKTAIYLLLLALISPWLYDRYIAFSAMLSNRPSKFKEIYNIKSHEIKFRDQLKNCEDVVLDENKGLAFLSCTPGRDRWNTVMGTFAPSQGLTSGQLWLLNYTNPLSQSSLQPLHFTSFPAASDFQPLGIEYDPETSLLYVVNHAITGSVLEIFSISLETKTAEHIQTIRHELLHTPNSIHLLGDGKLFISNDHFVRAAVSPLLSKIESFSGAPGGTVVFIDTKDVSTARVVARVPFANGLAMMTSDDGAPVLAVASSSKPGVYFFNVTSTFNLKKHSYVRTPSGVDNISVDSNGKLLLAGHPFAPTLMKVSAARARCDPDSAEELDRKACECWAPSWIAEWSWKEGLRELYKGSGFCSSSMVVRDVGRGVGMVSGLYERGVMFFEE
ncbi:hypothetical protein B0J11DRAFT_526533 [Dendryphion nanum]|uniref:Calcium-dependent phosphotriesterase n=1 Tax=Dendryphion nanum TaxID=256645 RepID=A0A9P9DXE5_9PLEO|nr:hypothetical protein B0J11DRAFT_526533 [Dendryphion nanum]